MRTRLLLALSLVAATMAAPTTVDAAGAEIGIRYYRAGVLLEDGTLDAGTTDVGDPFEFFLIIDSAGDIGLELGTITVPAGFTILDNPSNTTVAPGATASLGLRCDAAGVGVASGAIEIPSNAGLFEATLSCETVNGSGQPGMVLEAAGGPLLPDGTGEVEVLTGDEGQLIWIYNQGGAVNSLDLQPASATPSSLSVQANYVADNVIAYEGIPVYFYVTCEDSETEAPLLGDFEVSIPVNSWEDYYTFTVHCVAELTDDSGSGAGIPATGSASTTPLVLLALGLVGAGFGVRTVARRRA